MLKVVFCATLWECESALKNKNYGFKKICEAPFEVWRNKSKIVVITGIGLVNASVAFAWATKKFKFEESLNIGAVGLAITKKMPKKIELGKCYKISKVKCLEPYNDEVYKLGNSGKTLVSASRPISTTDERMRAGKFGELIDMEGYALVRSASIFSKKIEMIKMLTDFSEKCDIHANILRLSEDFAEMDNIWI